MDFFGEEYESSRAGIAEEDDQPELGRDKLCSGWTSVSPSVSVII